VKDLFSEEQLKAMTFSGTVMKGCIYSHFIHLFDQVKEAIQRLTYETIYAPKRREKKVQKKVEGKIQKKKKKN